MRRRTVLAVTVLAAATIPVGPAPAEATASRGGCRTWCLSYCDTVCRGGKRPACPDRPA